MSTTETLGEQFTRCESARAAVGSQALTEALAEAEGWAEHGYTPESRAYWAGMRDTLRVVLGVTTEAPRLTGPGADIAAVSILGAQRRAASTRTPRSPR